MAKQPRILVGQVAADHRRRPRHRQGDRRGPSSREGMKVAIGDLDPEPREQTAAGARRPTPSRFALNVTDRDSFDALRRRRRGAARRRSTSSSTTPGSCSWAVRRGGRRDDAADGRHQRPRRHARDEGGAAALRWPAAAATWSTSPRRPARAASPAARPTAAPSTSSSALSEAVRGELREDRPSSSAASCRSSSRPSSAAGLPRTRGVKKLEPEDVADAIVDALKDAALRRVRAALGRARTTRRIGALLPRRGREARRPRAEGRPRADRRRHAAPAPAYELRAAHSEPGLEPGEEPRQLSEQTP